MAEIARTCGPAGSGPGGSDPSYTLMSAAEADLKATYQDLVGGNNFITLSCYAGIIDDTCDWAGWTTSQSSNITIKAAAGAEHDGVFGAGFVMRNSGGGTVLTLSSDHITCQDIELYYPANGNGASLGGDECRLERCLIQAENQNSGGTGVTQQGVDAKIYNCIAWSHDQENSIGTRNGFSAIGGRMQFYNNTCVGDWKSRGFYTNSGSQNRKFYNCLSHTPGDDYHNNVQNSDLQYSGSSDLTAVGTGCWNGLLEADFNGFSIGDFSLVPGGQADGANNPGTIDPSSGLYLDDITRALRGDPWEMGAFDLGTVTAGPTLDPNFPQNATVFEGQTATFTVVVTDSTGTVSYQWIELPDTPVGTDSASYTTPPTVLADSGKQFRCDVTDDNGTTQSNGANLIVDSAPTGPELDNLTPADQTVLEGAQATFTVVVTSSEGPLSYQWYKAPATPVGGNSDSYTTPVTDRLDNGDQYFCDVTDDWGTTRSRTATLNVQWAPTVEAGGPYSGTELTAIPLDQASVTVGSDPTPTLLWEEVTALGGTFSNTGIQNPTFTPDVAGAYTLRLTVTPSDVGPVNDTASLTSNPVAAGPTIDQQPTPASQTVTEPDPASTTALATSSGGPLLRQWYKGLPGDITTPVPGETGDTLTIDPSTVSDTGTYYCRYTDDNGFTDTNTYDLTVNAAVVAPTVDAGGPYIAEVNTPELLNTANVVLGTDQTAIPVWSIDPSSAGGGVFSDVNEVNPTFTPDTIGAYTLTLTVDPNDGPPVVDNAALDSQAPGVIDEGIFQGANQINAINLGSGDIQEVYVGNQRVWPVWNLISNGMRHRAKIPSGGGNTFPDEGSEGGTWTSQSTRIAGPNPPLGFAAELGSAIQASADNDWLRRPLPGWIGAQQDCTFTFWARVQAGRPASNGQIWLGSNILDWHAGHAIETYAAGGGNEFMCRTGDGLGLQDSNRTSRAFDVPDTRDGQWHFFAYKFAGPNGNSMFIDETKYTWVAEGGTSNAVGFTSGALELWICNVQDWNNHNVSVAWGDLCDLRMYDRILDDAEILRIARGQG